MRAQPQGTSFSSMCAQLCVKWCPSPPSTPRSNLCQPSATQAGRFPPWRGARRYKNALTDHAEIKRWTSGWRFSRGAGGTGLGFGHVSLNFPGHESRVVPAAQLRAPTSWCVSIAPMGSELSGVWVSWCARCPAALKLRDGADEFF